MLKHHPLRALKVYGNRTHLLAWEESVYRYRKGGLHPVHIDDTFKDGRYTIRAKLGRGAKSTVWLARDNTRGIWVALKILQADMTDPTREIRTLQALAEKAPEGLASKNIIMLLDHFQHSGPNGCHQCIVLELVGPSYRVMREGTRSASSPSETLPVMKRVLEGLAFIHEAGFAHGDINVGNYAVALSRLPYLTEEELLWYMYAWNQDDLTQDLVRCDGKPLKKGIPAQYVRSADWSGPFWEALEEGENPSGIRIIDFDASFPRDEMMPGNGPEFSFNAPETILWDSPDYRIDLWNVGITLYNLIFNSPPGFGYHDSFPKSIWIITMISLFGKLPAQWEPKFEKLKREEEEKSGESFDLEVDEEERDLERSFDRPGCRHFWKALIPIIKGLTAHWPADRMSAEEAYNQVLEIGDEYFKTMGNDSESDGPESGDPSNALRIGDASIKKPESRELSDEECLTYPEECSGPGDQGRLSRAMDFPAILDFSDSDSRSD